MAFTGNNNFAPKMGAAGDSTHNNMWNNNFHFNNNAGIHMGPWQFPAVPNFAQPNVPVGYAGPVGLMPPGTTMYQQQHFGLPAANGSGVSMGYSGPAPSMHAGAAMYHQQHSGLPATNGYGVSMGYDGPVPSMHAGTTMYQQQHFGHLATHGSGFPMGSGGPALTMHAGHAMPMAMGYQHPGFAASPWSFGPQPAQRPVSMVAQNSMGSGVPLSTRTVSPQRHVAPAPAPAVAAPAVAPQVAAPRQQAGVKRAAEDESTTTTAPARPGKKPRYGMQAQEPAKSSPQPIPRPVVVPAAPAGEQAPSPPKPAPRKRSEDKYNLRGALYHTHVHVAKNPRLASPGGDKSSEVEHPLYGEQYHSLRGDERLMAANKAKKERRAKQKRDEADANEAKMQLIRNGLRGMLSTWREDFAPTKAEEMLFRSQVEEPVQATTIKDDDSDSEDDADAELDEDFLATSQPAQVSSTPVLEAPEACAVSLATETTDALDTYLEDALTAEMGVDDSEGEEEQEEVSPTYLEDALTAAFAVEGGDDSEGEKEQEEVSTATSEPATVSPISSPVPEAPKHAVSELYTLLAARMDVPGMIREYNRVMKARKRKWEAAKQARLAERRRQRS